MVLEAYGRCLKHSMCCYYNYIDGRRLRCTLTDGCNTSEMSEDKLCVHPKAEIHHFFFLFSFFYSVRIMTEIVSTIPIKTYAMRREILVFVFSNPVFLMGNYNNPHV